MTSEVNLAKNASSFTEDEQHVGGNAFDFFKAKQYDAALGILKKLQKSHSSDVRLMHNRALTEFYKSGKTKVGDLKKNLVKIQKQIQQHSNEDEDFATCGEKNSYVALHYNHAFLLYNVHQYKECENILERIYHNLDGSDEYFFLKVCLLLIDTYIQTSCAEKAISLISTVEKTFLTFEDSSKKNGNPGEKDLEPLRNYLCFLNICCFLQTKSIKSCKREIKSLSNIIGPPISGTQASTYSTASVFLKSNFEFVKGNNHKAYKLLSGSPPPQSNTVSNGLNEGLMPMYYNDIALIYFALGKYHLGVFYMQKAMHENDVAVTAAAKQHYSSLGTSGGRHQHIPIGKPLHVLSMNRRYELLYNLGMQYLFAGNPSVAFECLLATVHGFQTNPRLWLRLAECCIQKCTNYTSELNSKNSNKKSHQQNAAAYFTVGNNLHRKIVVNNSIQHIGGKGNNFVFPSPTMEFASVCLNNALTILNMAMNRFKEENSRQEERIKSNKKTEPEKVWPRVTCLPGPSISGSQFTQLYASVLANSAFVGLYLGNTLVALEHAQTLLGLEKLSGCHRYLAHMYAAEALVSLDRISEAIQHLSTDKVHNVSVELDDNGKISPTSVLLSYFGECVEICTAVVSAIMERENKYIPPVDDFFLHMACTDDGVAKGNQGNNNQPRGLARHGAVSSPWHFPTNLSCAHGYMILNLANAHCLRSEYEKAQGLIRQANLLVTARQAPSQALLLGVYLNLLCGGDEIPAAMQMLRHNTLVMPLQGFPPLGVSRVNNGSTVRQISTAVTGSVAVNSGGNAVESSSSSTSSSAPRSKSNTPQPSSGGVTPERVVKAKGSEGKKRSRR